MKSTAILTSALALFALGSISASAATNAYDVTGATNVAVNPYHGSAGMVFTVTTAIQLDQLGVMGNTTVGTMDAGEMYTRLWILNNPTVDVSDATKLAEVNFDVGLTAASGLHNTWWYLYLQDPDTGAGVTLTPGNTYVISNTTDDAPARTMMSVPNSAVVGGEINHVISRWGTAGLVPTNDGGAGVDFGGPTFTYTVVPEPGVASLGLGALLLGLARRRRACR